MEGNRLWEDGLGTLQKAVYDGHYVGHVSDTQVYAAVTGFLSYPRHLSDPEPKSWPCHSFQLCQHQTPPKPHTVAVPAAQHGHMLQGGNVSMHMAPLMPLGVKLELASARKTGVGSIMLDHLIFPSRVNRLLAKPVFIHDCTV
ncbi:hypothetical protein BTVI_157962 [Pitangus sulphuratus]|nr:hypothetical protein BTVI_157962 [Pitangus sulphuratus]